VIQQIPKAHVRDDNGSLGHNLLHAKKNRGTTGGAAPHAKDCRSCGEFFIDLLYHAGIVSRSIARVPPGHAAASGMAYPMTGGNSCTMQTSDTGGAISARQRLSNAEETQGTGMCHSKILTLDLKVTHA